MRVNNKDFSKGMKAVLAGTLLLAASGSAGAFTLAGGPVTGGFSFTGSFNLPANATLADATSLLFPSGFTVLNSSGSAANWVGATGTIQDLTSFNVTTPILGYITSGSLTFELDSLSVSVQNSHLLGLVGNGWLMGPLLLGLNAPGGNGAGTGGGSGPAPATLLLSAQSIGTIQSFSGTITTVPVPAAVWLFGSGLLGLAGVARRRGTEKASERHH